MVVRSPGSLHRARWTVRAILITLMAARARGQRLVGELRSERCDERLGAAASAQPPSPASQEAAALRARLARSEGRASVALARRDVDPRLACRTQANLLRGAKGADAASPLRTKLAPAREDAARCLARLMAMAPAQEDADHDLKAVLADVKAWPAIATSDLPAASPDAPRGPER